MIQRIQSIHLFLAAIICFAFLFIPIATAPVELKATVSFKAIENIIASSISSGILLLSIIIIFLYKNRPLQIRLIYITMALLFAMLAYTYFFISKNALVYKINILFFAPLIAVVFYFLALRSIRKDEELVKSMDRLR